MKHQSRGKHCSQAPTLLLWSDCRELRVLKYPDPGAEEMLLLLLVLVPGCVLGQGRFLDDILRWRTDSDVLSQEDIRSEKMWNLPNIDIDILT